MNLDVSTLGYEIDPDSSDDTWVRKATDDVAKALSRVSPVAATVFELTRNSDDEDDSDNYWLFYFGDTGHMLIDGIKVCQIESKVKARTLSDVSRIEALLVNKAASILAPKLLPKRRRAAAGAQEIVDEITSLG